LIASFGEGFENVEELKHLKEVLLDLLLGEFIENLNLVGYTVPLYLQIRIGCFFFTVVCGLKSLTRMELGEVGRPLHGFGSSPALMTAFMKTTREKPKMKVRRNLTNEKKVLTISRVLNCILYLLLHFSLS
jgi:ribosome production factor 2